MKGVEIFRDCDRHRVETLTLSKYVTEYEQMWKWMVEFLSKFQGRGIKIDRCSYSYKLPNHWFSAISYVLLFAKWRHLELSFSLRWTCILYFSLEYILWGWNSNSNAKVFIKKWNLHRTSKYSYSYTLSRLIY